MQQSQTSLQQYMGLHQRQIGLKSLENIDWSGKEILDIGCSSGELSVEILEKTRAKKLIGVDPNRDRISEAVDLVASKNLENIEFFVGSSENLGDFSDNSFDAVFCNMAFQQFKESQKALSEMFRVLKKDGEAIINFNIEKSPIWMQYEILYNRYYGDSDKKITKNKNMNEKNFYEIAKNAGFSTISTSIESDTYFYQTFEEAIGMMDVPYSSQKKLSEEQVANLNKELKKYLEFTRTEKGIPETWKILFAKLIK